MLGVQIQEQAQSIVVLTKELEVERLLQQQQLDGQPEQLVELQAYYEQQLAHQQQLESDPLQHRGQSEMRLPTGYC